MRRPYVAANWKMNKTVGEAEDFVERFIGSVGEFDRVDVALCPPFTALATLVDRTRRSPVEVLAQNIHFEESGAFTGEISIPMLAELGVAGAIIGHSERRQMLRRDRRCAGAQGSRTARTRACSRCCAAARRSEQRDAGETRGGAGAPDHRGSRRRAATASSAAS